MGAGALLGGIAGAQRQNTTQSYATQLAPESDLEKQGGQVAGQGLTQFGNLINMGPGQQDISAGLSSSRSLADMLAQFSQGGFIPNQQQMTSANDMARAMYAPQQTALNQRFQDQSTMFNRRAAAMGRSPNDPVLLNKLLQEQTRQQQSLDSEMGAYGMQQAWQLPQQQLQFAQQLAQVNNGLASQAMANRQALVSMGAQLRQQEQSFRAGTASREMTTGSGGGWSDILGGALGGMGMGAKMGGMFGGGAAAPAGGGQMMGTPSSTRAAYGAQPSPW